MSRVTLPLLAIGLLGLQLSACSHAEPAPKDFVLVDPHAAEDAPPADTGAPGSWSKIGKEKGGKAKRTKGPVAEGPPPLEVVEAGCKAEADRKGTASMLAIFSRLRRGSGDADYLACMKEHGYDVKP
jgi:hypothetical protein